MILVRVELCIDHNSILNMNFNKGKKMKFIISMLLALVTSSAMAKETYQFIVPNPPGTASDLVARTMATIYNRKTGNSLVIQNVSGGNHIPAAVKAMTASSPNILMTTTTMMVFNAVAQQSVPYDLNDFHHIAGISYAPIVWLARTDSPYYTMQDLVTKLPKSNRPFVAFANNVEIANLVLLARKNNWPNDLVQGVRYKGVPLAVQGLVSGDTDVAVVSTASIVNAQIQAGKIRVLATTVPVSINIEGQNIQPVKNTIGAEQVTGGTFLALNKKFDPTTAAKVRADLLEVLSDPEFLAEIQKGNQIPFDNKGSDQTVVKFFEDFRKTLRELNLNLN